MVQIVEKIVRSPLVKMSEATGLSYHALRRIFNGRTQYILVPVAEKLAAYANVPISELPAWIESQKKKLGYVKVERAKNPLKAPEITPKNAPFPTTESGK